MPGVEVSSGEIKRRLSDTQRAEVDRHLSEGRSVALYDDERGRPTLIITYGNRSADVPGPAPARYGGGTLSEFVPAVQGATPMISPAMTWEQVPQITRPRVSENFTERPSGIEMREGYFDTHARSREFINLLPGRQEEVPQEPQQPLSEEAQWWADRL